MDIKLQDQQPEKIKNRFTRRSRAREASRRPGAEAPRPPARRRPSGAHQTKPVYRRGGQLGRLRHRRPRRAANILLIGLGKAEEIGTETWRKAGARARKEAAALGAEDFAFYFAPEKDEETAAGAVAEGALLASYQFHKYRSDGKPRSEVRSMTLFRSGLGRSAGLRRAIDLAAEAIPGVFAARDLVNEPPSVANARFIGAAAERSLPRPAGSRPKCGTRKKSRR
jgi:leucyl aminopeptidase